MLNINFFIAIIISYLFGSISSAIIVAKIMRLPDPRTEGSKNPGATNLLRIGGKKAAIFTLLGDMLKGFIPVLAAKYMGFDAFSLSIIALSAFIGHLYPIFFGFQGGKGVATALGVTLALSWPLGLTMMLTWVLVAILFRYSSLAALIMTLLVPFYAAYFLNIRCAGVVAVMSVFLIIRHRENIKRLFNGTETAIGGRPE